MQVITALMFTAAVLEKSIVFSTSREPQFKSVPVNALTGKGRVGEATFS
jgi:hypothetical protein